MYQFIPQHSCDYLKKISIKINLETDEGKSRNEIWHWTQDKIRAAAQSWLWVQVELMAYLSRLERLDRIQWLWVQIPIRSTSYYFEEYIYYVYVIYT